MDEKRLVDGTTALAEKQPRVIKIEPTERPQNVRLRVAAYTRVSSDSEDQLNSFAAQNRYYTELISSKAEWRMVDIYADEGITGTSVAKRDDFQRMMADCRRGLIDQILVKSISRFARNTKDCLQNIRELKELGVNVRFEREGIDTVNVSSELITAIYAAFAQKESESISGNMQWSYQRRMESGEFNTCKAPWGFRLDGRKLKICEPEADIVQRIFREYLSGKNPQEIADDLNASCLTERVWNYKAVDYILQNERYAGNALLQKRYTPDMLSRQQKTNHGEREMYFVPGSNDAIISPEIFKRAQGLRQKRSLPGYDRLLSAQCAPDAGFLAVVQRHAGTAWRSASLELDTERCDHGGRAARRGAPLVHPAGYSTESIQGGASANDRGFCVSGKCSRRKGRCVV